MKDSIADPVAFPDSVFSMLSVCVQNGVHLRVMTWRPKKPVSEAPIVFVAGWVSAVSGWMPLLKVMASRRPVYYVETREKRSALIEKRKLKPDDETQVFINIFFLLRGGSVLDADAGSIFNAY